MTASLVLLAVLMAAVTYPSRAIPMLVPGVDRWPPFAIRYLQLMGPAVLASLAAANVAVATAPDGVRAVTLGIDAVGVGVCVVMTRWRGNLLLGLACAIAVVAAWRAFATG